MRCISYTVSCVMYVDGELISAWVGTPVEHISTHSSGHRSPTSYAEVAPANRAVSGVPGAVE